MHENPISKVIVDSAYKIHTILGAGLLESVYEVVLSHELRKRGLEVVRQLSVPVFYEEVTPVHKKQLLTYLRLMDKRLGLLINFNTALIKHGISRVANGLE